MCRYREVEIYKLGNLSFKIEGCALHIQHFSSSPIFSIARTDGHGCGCSSKEKSTLRYITQSHTGIDRNVRIPRDYLDTVLAYWKWCPPDHSSPDNVKEPYSLCIWW